MIGSVNEQGLPVIDIEIGGGMWSAVIDTGFNGDVELPASLKDILDKVYLGSVESKLAGGVTTSEECFYLEFPFDGRFHPVQATFVETQRVLIGTRLLRDYHLSIDFPAGTLLLERVETSP